PPEPTTNKLPSSEASTQRDAALVPVILGLLLVLLLAGALTWKRSLRILVVPYQIPQLTGHSPEDIYADVGLPEHQGSSQDILTMGGLGSGSDSIGSGIGNDGSIDHHIMVENYLRLESGDSPLDSEPAGLPMPDQGQRVAGIMRSQGQHQEEIAQ